MLGVDEVLKQDGAIQLSSMYGKPSQWEGGL